MTIVPPSMTLNSTLVCEEVLHDRVWARAATVMTPPRRCIPTVLGDVAQIILFWRSRGTSRRVTGEHRGLSAYGGGAADQRGCSQPGKDAESVASWLTAVPDSIGQLTRLTVLGLARNRLTTVPDSIGQLTSLTKLNIAGNPQRRGEGWFQVTG